MANLKSFLLHFFVWSGASMLVTGSPVKSRQVRQISDDEMLFRQICQIGDGVYRHPYSCNGFIQCKEGVFTPKECPFNMVYNVLVNACDFKWKLKCRITDGFSDFGDSIDETATSAFTNIYNSATDAPVSVTTQNVAAETPLPTTTVAPKKAVKPAKAVAATPADSKQLQIAQTKDVKEEECVIWEDI